MLEGLTRCDHGVVGAEEDLAPSPPAQIVDQLGRVAAGGVGAGVDVDVGVFVGHRDHLRGPRVADVPADDGQFGEVQRDLVDVRDRPARLGGAQRSGVSDLGAERDAQLDAGGVQRVVEPVGGRQLPQPRHDPEGHEAQLLDGPPQLPHGRDGLGQVRARHPAQPPFGPRDELGDLVVVDEGPLRSVPGRGQPDLHVGRRQRRHRDLHRKRLLQQPHAGPALQRLEHLVVGVAQCGVLHPRVDDRHDPVPSPGSWPSDCSSRP